MNDILMNRLTDAQDYKHIADEVYAQAQRSYHIYNGYSEADRDVCLKFAKEALANKAGLIELLKKHPNWDDKEKRIRLTTTESRVADPDLARSLLSELSYVLLCTTDDIARIGKLGAENAAALRDLGSMLSEYGVRREFVSRTQVSAQLVAYVKSRLPQAYIHEGTKCTKALIRLLRQFGVPAVRYPDSLQEEDSYLYKVMETEWRARIASFYTQYADAMNPLELKRQVLISVNPADFLGMSIGNSWNSCHDIRNSGGWQAGCSSYAYDKQTIIMYTVEANTPEDEITKASKLSRQLIFWNGSVLFPCRIYPQCTDGDSEVYAQFRQIIEEVMATCLGVPNLWKKVCDNAGEDCSFISEGRQYKDYSSSSYSFRVYAPSEWDRHDLSFHIGSDDAICLSCGDYLTDDGAVVCDSCMGARHSCARCGDYYDEDDMTYIDGEYVCEYCRDNYYTYCDHCGEYHDSDYTYEVYVRSRWGNRREYSEYWCEDCVNRDAFFCEGSETYYADYDYDSIQTEDGYTLEKNWAEDNASYCEECERFWYLDSHSTVRYREDAEEYMCDDCYEEWLKEHEAEAENNKEVA